MVSSCGTIDFDSFKVLLTAQDVQQQFNHKVTTWLVFYVYFVNYNLVLGADFIEGSATMALNAKDYDRHEHDKLETELSAHTHCNGLVMSQSNVDSSSMHETAHDWEEYKTMDKDFYDDGTITFFW